MQDVAIEVPGGRINVWHRPPWPGSPTAVLVHGLSGNSRWWLRVIEYLPERMGIIALDVRGRAGSVDAPPPFDLNTLAEDIAIALRHFELDRAIVAGYSMGGWVVAVFAHSHPEMVQQLILVDGGLPIPANPDADAEQVIDAVVGPSLARIGVEFASEESFFDYWRAHPALERHWDDAMKPALGHELQSVDGKLRVVANPEAIEVSARQITMDPEMKDAGAHLEVPTHMIVVERGTADQVGGMIPVDTAVEATRANPLMTMEFLAGVNHYTLILGDGAAVVAAAIIPG